MNNPFVVVSIYDGILGPVHIERTFGEAVDTAVEMAYEQTSKKDVEDFTHDTEDHIRAEIRAELEDANEYGENDWCVYVGQAE